MHAALSLRAGDSDAFVDVRGAIEEMVWDRRAADKVAPLVRDARFGGRPSPDVSSDGDQSRPMSAAARCSMAGSSTDRCCITSLSTSMASFEEAGSVTTHTSLPSRPRVRNVEAGCVDRSVHEPYSPANSDRLRSRLARRSAMSTSPASTAP